ncbi:MAG: hypothetical protein L6428_16540 [Candidatus Aminicenantes bacterium]|nr:hypothetical protein [Acidobacteriota bacterium]MBU4404509.1 hypothetical protein [Acidobacteriota bacterium]MCG2813039.1 hypothetical protein [Candidatus Aminicenantes bacterium]
MRKRNLFLSIGIVLWITASAIYSAEKIYKPNMDNCAGFTAADAGEIMNLPASAITAKTEKKHAALWMCTFSSSRKKLSFSIELTKSEVEASIDMARYRESLELEARTASFKGRLPKGAWSEVLPLGEESTWTDITHTLTVRQGNLTIQVQPFMNKLEQIKLVRAFLKKLEPAGILIGVGKAG